MPCAHGCAGAKPLLCQPWWCCSHIPQMLWSPGNFGIFCWPSVSLHTHRSCQCCRLLLPLHVLQRDKCLGLLVPLPLLPGVWVPNSPAWPRCGCGGSQWLFLGAGCCMAPLSTGNGEMEGCQKLQKPRALLQGKVRQWCGSPWSCQRHWLLSSPHHGIQVEARLVTPWSHVPWCQGALHPGMGLSDVRGEVGHTVEAWRVSLPGERVKEAQSLGRESVWSSKEEGQSWSVLG